MSLQPFDNPRMLVLRRKVQWRFILPLGSEIDISRAVQQFKHFEIPILSSVMYRTTAPIVAYRGIYACVDQQRGSLLAIRRRRIV